jgi:hypothetical protein
MVNYIKEWQIAERNCKIEVELSCGHRKISNRLTVPIHKVNTFVDGELFFEEECFTEKQILLKVKVTQLQIEDLLDKRKPVFSAEMLDLGFTIT